MIFVFKDIKKIIHQGLDSQDIFVKLSEVSIQFYIKQSDKSKTIILLKISNE